MLAYKCDSCKKVIDKEKHRFVSVTRMKLGENGSYYGDLHFCSPECLIKFMEVKV